MDIPIYAFDDDPEYDGDLSDVSDIGPVDIASGELIPHASLLSDLMAEHGPADGFVAWATYTLSLFEAEQAVENIDDLEDARTDLQAAYAMSMGDKYEGRAAAVTNRMAERRAVLLPFLAEGWTLRRVANFCNVPLAQVMSGVNPTWMANAESYALLDELLVAGASKSDCVRQCGLPRSTVYNAANALERIRVAARAEHAPTEVQSQSEAVAA